MQKKNSQFLDKNTIRLAFSKALSEMYEKEVPLYKDMLNLVRSENSRISGQDSSVIEHHGAIRIGTPAEARIITRLFNVLGMLPVGYYNLAPAGLPVHSTAYRAIDEEGLKISSLRIFTSLLRMDLIPKDLQEKIREPLEGREIITPKTLELIKKHENKGGLTHEEANEFISEALNTFKRSKRANVPLELYRQLLEVNSLLADIAGFKNPHINHLTPRVLNIDEFHRAMINAKIATIPLIQGPPKRKTPILLRQTSFQALEEEFLFPKDDGTFEKGMHRARFGEFETKNAAALTPKGRALYDKLLTKATGISSKNNEEYQKNLSDIFKDFPDDLENLRTDELIFVKYKTTGKPLSPDMPPDIDGLIENGFITYETIFYEDFLPISATSIFKSNLKEGGTVEARNTDDKQSELESAIGREILDPNLIYEAIQTKSLEKVFTELGVKRNA